MVISKKMAHCCSIFLVWSNGKRYPNEVMHIQNQLSPEGLLGITPVKNKMDIMKESNL